MCIGRLMDRLDEEKVSPSERLGLLAVRVLQSTPRHATIDSTDLRSKLGEVHYRLTSLPFDTQEVTVLPRNSHSHKPQSLITQHSNFSRALR